MVLLRYARVVQLGPGKPRFVSIPASGIMVLLQEITAIVENMPSLPVSIPASGIMVLLQQ